MDLRERPAAEVPRHPWEVARSRFFLDVLDRFGALDRPRDWLDVGAGDAWAAEQLHRRLPAPATVVGWDINYTSEDLDRCDKVPGVQLTATRPDGSFGGMLLLDVIEHVGDDQAFLGDILTNLAAPRSWVLVSVPAHPALFSDHDRFLQHYRRYRSRQLLEVLDRAGVEVLASGGVFHAPLVARAAAVAGQRLLRRPGSEGGVGAWSGGPAVTSAVTAALRLDTKVSLLVAGRRRHLPGLSFWAMGRAG
ncbi:MAG: methyltransferase domain-containing protein [Acidimicrobiales bacterium]